MENVKRMNKEYMAFVDLAKMVKNKQGNYWLLGKSRYAFLQDWEWSWIRFIEADVHAWIAEQ